MAASASPAPLSLSVYNAVKLKHHNNDNDNDNDNVLKVLRAHDRPYISLTKPRLWPGANGSDTHVRLAWDNKALYLLYQIFGSFKQPSLSSTSSVDKQQHDKMAAKFTILNDDRCEVFIAAPLLPPTPSSLPSPTTISSDNDGNDDAKQSGSDSLLKEKYDYYCWEVNHGGRACDFKAKWGRTFDYTWTSHYTASFIPSVPSTSSTSATPSAIPSADDSKSTSATREVMTGEMLLTIPWIDIGIMDISSIISSSGMLRVGIYRAQSYVKDDGSGNDFIWTSWIDSQLTDVNFHRIETFGHINLVEDE